MPSSGLGAYQVKIHQIVFGGLFLAVAFLGLKGLAAGNVTSIKTLGALSIIAAGIFALDKYFWLVCPILLVVSFSIPGLPFNSGELGRMLLIGIFFVRAALQKSTARPFPKELLIALPYFIWVGFIFLLNPTGMSIIGSETIGARFYFQIALGFLTLMTFSKLTISERDARYWVHALIIGLVFHFAIALSGFATLEFDEDSSKYFLIPAAPLLMILLCRYDLCQILSMSWRFPASMLLAFAVAYSGKRTSMGQVFLAPFVLVLLRKREKVLLTIMSILGAVIIGFVVVGHGRIYDLPFSVQRSLSFLPGKWDARLEQYGFSDPFREAVQQYAIDQIKKDPWLGRKGFTMSRFDTAWMLAQQDMGQEAISGHAYAGNWHNKFYGMAADFGFFASFSWYFFAVFAALYCLRNRQLFGVSGYRLTLFLYYSLYMFYDLAFAFGHSALTPYAQWTTFGFIIALVRSAKEQYVNAPSQRQIPVLQQCADIQVSDV